MNKVTEIFEELKKLSPLVEALLCANLIAAHNGWNWKELFNELKNSEELK